MFISAAADDAGLRPTEFRVLAHICRRAGDGQCWAAASSIAETCRINLKTARQAIANLERLGWVKSQKRTGQTTVLIPTIPPDSDSGTPTNPIPYPKEYPTQSNTPHPTQSNTHPPTQLNTHEGNPIRIPQKDTQPDLLTVDTFLDTLWKSFPAKSRERSSKTQLATAWQKAKTPPSEEIIASARKWASCEDWTKQNGQFAPGAHLWVKNRKWEIEPTPNQINQPRSTNDQFNFKPGRNGLRSFD
jgi:hypothetical protein